MAGGSKHADDLPASPPVSPVDAAAGNGDIAALAKGGRTNVIGFLLRLAARLPFLFVAGRIYGAEALGRFAYAILIVELAAQLATLGLKRGLAEQLSRTSRPHVHVVWDGLLLSFLGSSLAAALLVAFPQLMFPNSATNGLDRYLPVVIFAIAGTDVALAALAYRYDIGATVRARSIVEPWTISIVALLFAWPVFAFYSLRDGLIISYVVSMLAALATALWPLIRSYGLPWGWRPRPLRLAMMARRYVAVAGADAVEWGSRRLDLAILGLFASPAVVGIYYIAQQVASLPQKMKTSFDPILGPVITRSVADKDYGAIARQVSQVGFWIIAAQVGIALALGIPGEAVMGLIGPQFVGGTGALAFLLAAEAIAATAVVSEAALIYLARHRNLFISLSMLLLQAGLSVALIQIVNRLGYPPLYQTAAVALGLMLALAYASLVKAWLLSRLLKTPINVWRWPLIWAISTASLVGAGAVMLPEWAELIFGIPMILVSYGWVIWRWGFAEDDRALFRKS